MDELGSCLVALSVDDDVDADESLWPFVCLLLLPDDDDDEDGDGTQLLLFFDLNNFIVSPALLYSSLIFAMLKNRWI